MSRSQLVLVIALLFWVLARKLQVHAMLIHVAEHATMKLASARDASTPKEDSGIIIGMPAVAL